MTLQQQAKVLSKIKTRLQITTNDVDALIDEYIEEIGLRILHYTNLLEMPDGLLSVWSSMVIDLLRVNLANSRDIFGDSVLETGGISSISEGDVSVSYGRGSTVADNIGGGTSKTIIDEIVNNYANDLHRYRILRY